MNSKSDAVRSRARLMVMFVAWWGAGSLAWGQELQCDPAKVMTADTCIRCHGSEVAQWRLTKHHSTFETLARNPRAKEITGKLGLSSIKRNEICVTCHFTVQEQNGRLAPIAGISCESCHGASRDWVAVHNDYGGPLATRQTESLEHRMSRLQRSQELGMRNTANIYRIAQSCLECHTVPHERLVDIGGHAAGSATFEFVSWSQGVIRHNFVRSGGSENGAPSRDRLRVMYVAGLLADLEFSTRAVAAAKSNGEYGVTVAQRAAATAQRLLAVYEQAPNRHVYEALLAFSEAELRTENAEQLNAIADRIESLGLAFVDNARGENLAGVDEFLPEPAEYKY